MPKKKNDTTAKTLGVIAALAAGAYFLYGTKEGAKKRKEVKSWALRMKADVMDKIEKVKDIDEEKYKKTIDVVAEKYKKKLKTVEKKEVERLRNDLKKHWRAIKKDLK